MSTVVETYDHINTDAENYGAILMALAVRPMTLDELHVETKLSYRDLNTLICALRLKGQVACESVRAKGKPKANQYSLKLKGV